MVEAHATVLNVLDCLWLKTTPVAVIFHCPSLLYNCANCDMYVHAKRNDIHKHQPSMYICACMHVHTRVCVD